MQQIATLIDKATAKYGTQLRIAEEMNNSPKLISQWRNGHKTPSDEAVYRLAEIAGEKPEPWVAAIAVIKTGINGADEIAKIILRHCTDKS